MFFPFVAVGWLGLPLAIPDILTVVAWLSQSGALLLARGKRVGSEEVLAMSRQRLMIMRIVEKEPGLPLGELLSRVSIGWGTLHHHVQMLVRHGYLQLARVGRRQLVYAAHMHEADAQVRAKGLLLGATARRLAEAMMAHPQSTVGELVKITGDSHRVVYYHIKRFHDAGLAQDESGVGAGRTFSATPLLADAVASFRA